jgi:hypothetical protein
MRFHDALEPNIFLDNLGITSITVMQEEARLNAVFLTFP